MKIIHTSDWHIGQNFYRYNRTDEHLHFICQLEAVLKEHKPDALLVSGDIFDNAAPTAQARRLFIDAVLRLHDAAPNTVIVITAGNHDSGLRLEAERQLWGRLGIHVVGSCTRSDDGTFDPRQFVVDVTGKGTVAAVPFIHPSNFPAAEASTPADRRQGAFFSSVLAEAGAPGLPVVLMAHLAVNDCDIRGHEDKVVGGMITEDIATLGSGYDYLALGHIHMPQQIDERTYYCGSPFPMSFSEDYDHYVNLVEIPAHGAVPRVQQIRIDTARRVLTVPADGAPLEEALEALRDIPDTCADYVRVLVDQKETLAPDAEDRARKIVDGKECRFCEVRTVARTREYTPQEALDVRELSDFTTLDPMDIARRSYLRKTGEELDPELASLLDYAITHRQSILSKDGK